MSKLVIFAGNANPELASSMAEQINIPLGDADVGVFSDGEVAVDIQENVRGKDVFIVQSTCQPTNNNLMELLVMDPESARLRLTSELSLDRFNLPSMGPLLGEALKRRQDLVAAAREVVAARKTLSLSKRQLIPNLKVFGFMQEEEGADVAGLGVSMPIPVWDTRSGENQVARAELEQARIEEDALRLQVRTEVIGAVTDYNAARQRLEVFGKDVLASAEENVRLTEKAFRAGSVGAPTLAMAQDDLINTRREYLDALREAIGAAAALERSTGGVVALREAGTEQLKNTGDSES